MKFEHLSPDFLFSAEQQNAVRYAFTQLFLAVDQWEQKNLRTASTLSVLSDQVDHLYRVADDAREYADDFLVRLAQQTPTTDEELAEFIAASLNLPDGTNAAAKYLKETGGDAEEAFSLFARTEKEKFANKLLTYPDAPKSLAEARQIAEDLWNRTGGMVKGGPDSPHESMYGRAIPEPSVTDQSHQEMIDQYKKQHGGKGMPEEGPLFMTDPVARNRYRDFPEEREKMQRRVKDVYHDAITDPATGRYYPAGPELNEAVKRFQQTNPLAKQIPEDLYYRAHHHPKIGPIKRPLKPGEAPRATNLHNVSEDTASSGYLNLMSPRPDIAEKYEGTGVLDQPGAGSDLNSNLWEAMRSGYDPNHPDANPLTWMEGKLKNSLRAPHLKEAPGRDYNVEKQIRELAKKVSGGRFVNPDAAFDLRHKLLVQKLRETRHSPAATKWEEAWAEFRKDEAKLSSLQTSLLAQQTPKGLTGSGDLVNSGNDADNPSRALPLREQSHTSFEDQQQQYGKLGGPEDPEYVAGLIKQLRKERALMHRNLPEGNDKRREYDDLCKRFIQHATEGLATAHEKQAGEPLIDMDFVQNIRDEQAKIATALGGGREIADTSRPKLEREEFGRQLSRSQLNQGDNINDIFNMMQWTDEDKIRNDRKFFDNRSNLLKGKPYMRAGIESSEDFKTPKSTDAAFRHYLLEAALQTNVVFPLNKQFAVKPGQDEKMQSAAQRKQGLAYMYKRILELMLEDKYNPEKENGVATRFTGPIWDEYARRARLVFDTDPKLEGMTPGVYQSAGGKHVLHAAVGTEALEKLMGPEIASQVNQLAKGTNNANWQFQVPKGELNGISMHIFDDMTEGLAVFERGVKYEQMRRLLPGEPVWEDLNGQQMEHIVNTVYNNMFRAPEAKSSRMMRALPGYIGDPSQAYREKVTETTDSSGKVKGEAYSQIRPDAPEAKVKALLMQEVHNIKAHHLHRNPEKLQAEKDRVTRTNPAVQEWQRQRDQLMQENPEGNFRSQIGEAPPNAESDPRWPRKPARWTFYHPGNDPEVWREVEESRRGRRDQAPAPTPVPIPDPNLTPTSARLQQLLRQAASLDAAGRYDEAERVDGYIRSRQWQTV